MTAPLSLPAAATMVTPALTAFLSTQSKKGMDWGAPRLILITCILFWMHQLIPPKMPKMEPRLPLVSTLTA